MKDNVIRHETRVKDTGEVFTPDPLVQKMLDDLNVDWNNPPLDKSFLDPTCGNGQFLIELVKRGIPLENIYGVDLMPDNINSCRERVLEADNLSNLSNPSNPTPNAKEIIEKNIVQGDALTFDYKFN